MKRNELLDGWRGVAIISVLIGHFLHIPFINAGRFGVELFFVLSGRLMAELLFIRQEHIGEFYWRRLSRIIPTLYLYILIISGVSYFYPIISDATSASMLSSLTFTYNYFHNYAQGYSAAVFDHIWSLCIEEHTYIILGLIAIAVRSLKFQPFIICLGLATFCMLFGAYLTNIRELGYYDVFWRTDTRATGILLGCGLYTLLYKKPNLFLGITPRVTVLLIIMAASLSLYPVNDAIKYSFGTLALALAVTTIDRTTSYAKFILRNKVIRFFGRASFSIYLFQQPFYYNKGEHSILALSLALSAGLISFYLLEQPARRKLNNIYNKHLLRKLNKENIAN